MYKFWHIVIQFQMTFSYIVIRSRSPMVTLHWKREQNNKRKIINNLIIKPSSCTEKVTIRRQKTSRLHASNTVDRWVVWPVKMPETGLSISWELLPFLEPSTDAISLIISCDKSKSQVLNIILTHYQPKNNQILIQEKLW